VSQSNLDVVFHLTTLFTSYNAHVTSLGSTPSPRLSCLSVPSFPSFLLLPSPTSVPYPSIRLSARPHTGSSPITMSLDRRKPFALLQPNAKSLDAALATAQPSISRPRRQMPAYHHQHYHYQLQQNPHKRYATMIPGSSRSSATSSAESLYSTTSSMPRRRKLSAAEDVAARVRARWAALEALERTSGAPITAPTATMQQSADAIFASASVSATAAIRTGARIDPRLPELEREKEKENAASTQTHMQVDGHGSGSGFEKPLPPRPAALALHINPSTGHATTATALASAATTAVAVPMAVDARHEDGAGAGESSVPASDSTLRTTPTSLTCIEMESLQPVLQRRPTRALTLTPPQVRRRPSITDELEEAVRLPALPRSPDRDPLSLFLQREEATLAMLHSSRTDGLLRCPRRGCDELLGGVRALTFHLHIHSVSTGAYSCLRCGSAFESARDLTRHSCARHRARGAFVFPPFFPNFIPNSSPAVGLTIELRPFFWPLFFGL
jgi:hypothetical protein